MPLGINIEYVSKEVFGSFKSDNFTMKDHRTTVLSRKF